MPRLNGYGGETDMWGLTPDARSKWMNALLGGTALALLVFIVLYLSLADASVIHNTGGDQCAKQK